ncbi:MAG TPA: hypothetical protein VIH86_12790 [Puia sp.]
MLVYHVPIRIAIIKHRCACLPVGRSQLSADRQALVLNNYIGRYFGYSSPLSSTKIIGF